MDETKKSKSVTPEWPSTVRSRDELDSALEAGEKSGVSERSFDEIVKAAITRAKNA